MAKATTIKDALKRWEEKNSMDCTKAKVIELQFQWPPIEKMDSTLSTLKECEKLSLSTNCIDKIVGINKMKNLKILSLGRNYIKSLSGIESLADNLEQLWVSYNLIEKLRGIEVMRALKIFYIGHNAVKDWSEFMKMAIPPKLEEIVFDGNPLVESMDESVYKAEAMKRLPNLKRLDGEPIVRGVF